MPELELVTFNTHYGRRPPSARCVPYDLGSVLDELASADVLSVQEVWRPDGGPCLVERFAARQGYEMHEIVFGRAGVDRRWPGFRHGGGGTVGIAVLSRLPMRSCNGPVVGPTWRDPIAARRLLHVELDVGGVTTTLIGVHLTSRLPYGPPQQLRRLARQTADIGGPAVLAGDCNFWGPPAQLLLPGWARAVRGRSWPAQQPHSQIDHVFVRGPIEVVDGAVLPDVGSDHRPVRARLRVG
ncbi:MAG TPA: endonuclease/exonuclease/phosphatase family protein [Acidimicrobiia bacterium]|nr:endonuclease/exonuclease/phosphatase family protein [Acidimicrobiia bacterium]